MSNEFTREEVIRWVEDVLGVDLLPWQKEILVSILNGRKQKVKGDE